MAAIHFQGKLSPAPAHPNNWSTGLGESYGSGTRAVNSIPVFNLPLFQPWKIFQSHSIWLVCCSSISQEIWQEGPFNMQGRDEQMHKMCRGPETSGGPAWKAQEAIYLPEQQRLPIVLP